MAGGGVPRRSGRSPELAEVNLCQARLPDEAAGAATDEVRRLSIVGFGDQQHRQARVEAREFSADREAVVVAKAYVQQHAGRVVPRYGLPAMFASVASATTSSRCLEQLSRRVPESSFVIDDDHLRSADSSHYASTVARRGVERNGVRLPRGWCGASLRSRSILFAARWCRRGLRVTWSLAPPTPPVITTWDDPALRAGPT